MPINIPLKLAFLETGQQQIDVAHEIRMDNNRLSQIVQGRIVATPEERKALAKALKRPVSQLFPEVAA